MFLLLSPEACPHQCWCCSSSLSLSLSRDESTRRLVVAFSSFALHVASMSGLHKTCCFRNRYSCHILSMVSRSNVLHGQTSGGSVDGGERVTVSQVTPYFRCGLKLSMVRQSECRCCMGYLFSAFNNLDIPYKVPGSCVCLMALNGCASPLGCDRALQHSSRVRQLPRPMKNMYIEVKLHPTVAVPLRIHSAFPCCPRSSYGRCAMANPS